MALNALGINIFGGGFTLGVLNSKRFNVVSQWEECDAGAKTFDLNMRYFKGIHRPIGYTKWDMLLDEHIHFIYANPPCAPWSGANTRLGMTPDLRRADPRLAMTVRTMETALALRPDFFALESVARAYSLGRAYYDNWAEAWLKAGYGVTYYLTDGLLLGVPSTRQRFHFMAHRRELAIPEPNMKHFMPKTVSQVIGDLEDHYGHLPHHIPKRMSREAHELCRVVKEGRLLTGTDDADNDEVQRALANCEWSPSFLNRKLVWDAPGFTLVNLEQHVHPRKPRFLTWREGLRVAGYPDDFLVHNPQGATQAVLPITGEHIAKLAFSCMNNAALAQNELEIVDHRDLAKPYRPGSVRDEMESEGI